jgi:hypothetical protein
MGREFLGRAWPNAPLAREPRLAAVDQLFDYLGRPRTVQHRIDLLSDTVVKRNLSGHRQ